MRRYWYLSIILNTPFLFLRKRSIHRFIIRKTSYITLRVIWILLWIHFIRLLWLPHIIRIILWVIQLLFHHHFINIVLVQVRFAFLLLMWLLLVSLLWHKLLLMLLRLRNIIELCCLLRHNSHHLIQRLVVIITTNILSNQWLLLLWYRLILWLSLRITNISIHIRVLVEVVTKLWSWSGDFVLWSWRLFLRMIVFCRCVPLFYLLLIWLH